MENRKNEEWMKAYKVKVVLEFELHRNEYEFIKRLATLLDQTVEEFLIDEIKGRINCIPNGLDVYVNEETIREIYKLERG